MISLILPIYNVEKYLRECLDSIMNQSYKNYELIIVDDGSRDRSLEIVNEYRNKFKHIKILSQKNKGVSEARNLALKYAIGKYILFVDSDDFLRADMLEKLISIAIKAKCDVVISNYYLYYDKNNYIKFLKNMPSFTIYDNYRVVDMMLKYKIQGQLWNKLFKFSLLKENNFQFEKDRYIQDIFPVFKAISNANKISYLDEPLYFYRQREGSTVNKKNKKLTVDYYHAMTSVKKYIEENNIEINENSFKTFKAHILSYFIYHYTNESLNNNYNSFKKSDYYKLNISFKDFLFLKDLSHKDKLRIILWKLRIFNFIKKVKRKL
ncbi:glycosyltransferase family 2 protein [Clostridium nigeriense]|uniref:glycosyltransferase family 2 protein n=1 Tax=Clostridium nigeriense TaxID=1805470 RepID=UPI0008321D2C|nr:glycosyltransferase [Clostridium nigeriense]